jgi:hypothetical protein
MITTEVTINNVDTVMNIHNTSNEQLEHFRNVLNPLVEHGWRFIQSDLNIITMNKVFYELEEITIEYRNNLYHFTLPLNNSIYSYYKKFYNFYDALNYLKLYTDNLL